VIACKPWLRAELAVIKPELVVCLGAVAAQAMLGRVVGVTKERGKFLADETIGALFVTIHPSAILRERDKHAQEKAYHRFLGEIKMVRRRLGDKKNADNDTQ
jgi:DNA polymerase